MGSHGMRTAMGWMRGSSISTRAYIVELTILCHRGVGMIPKPDGRERPLGIASLEDKIVQRAVAEVLNAIYEEDFLRHIVRIPSPPKPT